MIKIPVETIIEKIKEKTNLSDNEIEDKIKEKLKHLSGLISREGAAHIVANDLGVKIFEQVSGKLKIKNILAGMRNVETVGKITNVYELREFVSRERSGKVASLVIGDETGSVRIVLWNDQANNLEKIKQGDVIKIVGGYVRENFGRLEVHINDKSRLIISPPGEAIGEIKETEAKIQAKRKKINELKESEPNVELFGTIVDVSDPKFFEVCPKCEKRARMLSNNFVCEEHGIVEPSYSYVLNTVLDDGSDNMRVVFFKKQANNLLSKNEEEIAKYRENIPEFEAVKTELKGKQIKVVGRVVKNTMFERLELISQLVFPNADPSEEIERLKKEIEVK
ncbi:hypothetical protein HYU07_00125 [Candidatus Woesearchaeota archaeon]|nr:hypothetical protein [Candidatus Woesearchaeota archaeon]